LLSMSPEEGMAFLRKFYSRETGNYYLSPDPIPLDPIPI
jgi:hypothetical protein